MLALIANVNRDPKQHRAFKPGDFHPHEQRPQAVLRGEGLRLLREVFVNRPPPNPQEPTPKA